VITYIEIAAAVAFLLAVAKLAEFFMGGAL
jgi:hypothetical protein